MMRALRGVGTGLVQLHGTLSTLYTRMSVTITSKVEFDKLGVATDYCRACRRVGPCEVRSLKHVTYANGIRSGSNPLGTTSACDCGHFAYVDPLELAAELDTENSTPPKVLREANVQRAVRLQSEHALESERIRRRQMTSEDRQRIVFDKASELNEEAVRLVVSSTLDRWSVAAFAVGGALALLGLLYLHGFLTPQPPRVSPKWIVFIPALLATGVGATAMQSGYGRLARRAIEPQLARLVADNRISRDEIHAALTRLQSLKVTIGGLLDADSVWRAAQRVQVPD